ncbi:MAG: Gfo/Idh/MocA family oxidoreductase [Elusimicrobia bacterium]|nr:Gfo/Idh/MocA family oxidoreductase [Elusimicrobiota bacterium]
MKKIKVGIIGVGQIGKNHLETYKNIPGVEIVAIADVNEEECKRVSKIHNIPYIYTDFRKLLKRGDIDAIDVCLHNNFHMPVTVASLESGKHVYCEKPMAGSYRDAFTMLKTARDNKLKLSIQLAGIFLDETKAAKVLIDKEHLGKIYHARSTGYRRRGRPFLDAGGSKNFVSKKYAGGGALFDMGVYHISALLYLMGNPEVSSISGKTYREIDVDSARKKQSGYDVEELGLGFVKFNKNITMDIIESWAIHLNVFEGSSIVGNRGGIRLQPFGFYRNLGDFELNSTADMYMLNRRWHSFNKNADAYDNSQQHWIAALQGRVKLLPTAELALNTMLISEGIYISDKLGREVTADEVIKKSKSTAVRL